MSETKEQGKPTPGPWTVDTQGSDDDFVIRSVRGKNMGGGSEVAIVTTGSYADAVEEANARLIAAAPELLEALRMVRGDVALSNTAHSLDPIVMEAVEAAISKAEGAQ